MPKPKPKKQKPEQMPQHSVPVSTFVDTDADNFKLEPPDLLELRHPWVAKGSRLNVLDHGFVKLVDYMGGDDAIVQAARVSHGPGTKTKRTDEGLIRYLVKNRHTTPLEQVQLKVHVSAPIFVFRQWHRHRTWSYNEVSARYTEMPDEFYIPEASRITTQDTKNRQGSTDQPIAKAQEAADLIREASRTAYAEYQRLLKMGVARELARTVLPVSLYSQMYATVNLKNLMDFISLRADPHAQREIQEYAKVLWYFAKKVAPVAVAAFEQYNLHLTLCEDNGIMIVRPYEEVYPLSTDKIIS